MKLRNPPNGPIVTLPSFPPVAGNVNVAGVASIDWSKGGAQRLTLTANANVTSLNLPPGEEAWVQLKLIQGGAGSFVPTFVGAKTPGTNPLAVSAAPGSIDILSGYWDGTTLFMTVGGLAFG